MMASQQSSTAPIHLQLGVFQGDPLSVIIFNTVMNTLVDSITHRCAHLGYSLNSISGRINLLQYADDTSLISDGPSSCQLMLTLNESWLSWPGMQGNVPKCVEKSKPPPGGPTTPTSPSVASPSPIWVTPPSDSWVHQWPSTPSPLRLGNTLSPSYQPCCRGLMTPPSNASRNSSFSRSASALV